MNKFIAPLLLLVSLSSNAQNLDANAALSQILPSGEYQGLTEQNQNCSVTVVRENNKIQVTATLGLKQKKATVLASSYYQWNPANRFFLSSNKINTSYGSKEDIFRTIAVTNSTQYIVVSELVIQSRYTNESMIECIVNY